MEYVINVGLSQISSKANGIITSGNVIGNPNIVCLQKNFYSVNCILYQRDFSTNYGTVVWQNTGTARNPSWTVVAVTSSLNSIYNEVVAGNGTSWALTVTPIPGSVRLYGGGSRLIPGVDYTISGENITTTYMYSAGQVIADYDY